ncbi:hypothetical protein K474DRAFT_1601835, partial [Panus rudis PR-1116 ss-1]
MASKIPPATVTKAPGSKHPPSLSDGTITPEVVHAYDMACRQYFKRKNIDAADQVAMVAGEMQGVLREQWYNTNATVLDALLWTEFLTAFKARRLPTGWESSIVSHLLRFRQKDADVFEDWATAVETQNALLVGT